MPVDGKTREDAWALVTEYTESESLINHMLAVEAAMRGYARKLGEDEDEWGILGLVHDFDYEKFPGENGHPFTGVQILDKKGFPREFRRAVLSHADYTGVPRESKMEKALFACDELCGFLVAVALVRPSKSFRDMKLKSVKKKLKDKSFAANVSREDIAQGAKHLGVPLDEHIENVIGFLAEVEEELGLGEAYEKEPAGS